MNHNNTIIQELLNNMIRDKEQVRVNQQPKITIDITEEMNKLNPHLVHKNDK